MASLFRNVVRWYGPEFVAKLEKHEADNLKRACIFLTGEVKQVLSTKSGPCNENRSERVPESEFNRSSPGEPPRLQCGELRRSITWEVDTTAMIGRVGSNKEYAKHLEDGTRRMAARPFLKTTLAQNRNAVRRILTTKMK